MPVRLLDFISLTEKSAGQDCDVPSIYADVSALADWVGFKPDTVLATDSERFVEWSRGYYKA